MIILLFLLLFPSLTNASTYYVRTGGGTPNGTGVGTCNGTVNVDYSAGVSPNCAYNHPNWPLPLSGQPTTWRISGGDTVIIGQGSYTIGCGTNSDCTQSDINITSTASCYNLWKSDCKAASIPSGTAGNHTKIYGEGYSTTVASNTATRPDLVGKMGTTQVMSVGSSSYVDIVNIRITDQDVCETGGTSPPTACTGTMIYGKNGLYGSSSSNIYLRDFWVEGMAQYGILAGGVTDWSGDRVTLYANGYGGWNGDDTGTPAFSGTFTFDHLTVTYNGCQITYPGRALIDCWGQSGSHGGYGDGIGFGNGNVGNWVITNSNISHNTQDGFDALHGTSPSSNTAYISRTLFEGNAGQPFKLTPQTIIENSIIIDNCGYFNGQTFSSGFIDDCRANTGMTFLVDAGIVHKILNSTIVDNTNVAVYSQGSNCDANTKIYAYNNIFYGGRNFQQDTAYNVSGDNRLSTFYYKGGSDGNGAGACGSLNITEDYNIVKGFKTASTPCGGAHSQCEVDPVFTSTLAMGPTTYETGDSVYQKVTLQVTSPAIGSGSADETVTLTGTSNDYNNFSRGAQWDTGAYEYGTIASCSNGVQDGDETGVDCGGSCGACSAGTLSIGAALRNAVRLNGSIRVY